MDPAPYVKNLYLGSFEYLLYKSLKHPAILQPLSFEMTSKRKFTMELPRGISVELDHFDDQDSVKLDKYLASILAALLYLEDHGICYGDVKEENTILVDDNYYLIDFDLFDYTWMPSVNVQQTYGDPYQSCYRRDQFRIHSPEEVKEEFKLLSLPNPYDHQKDFVWSVGVLIFRIVKQYNESTKEVPLKVFIRTGFPDFFFGGNSFSWTPFLEACFAPFSRRKRFLREIVHLLHPSLLLKIESINGASYRLNEHIPTNLPITCTDTTRLPLEPYYSDLTVTLSVVRGMLVISDIRIPHYLLEKANILHKRLTHSFLKEFDSDTYTAQEKVELLYVLCVFILGQHTQIFDSLSGLIIEILPTLVNRPIREIVDAESCVYKVLGFRYPDVFFDR